MSEAAQNAARLAVRCVMVGAIHQVEEILATVPASERFAENWPGHVMICLAKMVAEGSGLGPGCSREQARHAVHEGSGLRQATVADLRGSTQGTMGPDVAAQIIADNERYITQGGDLVWWQADPDNQAAEAAGMDVLSDSKLDALMGRESDGPGRAVVLAFAAARLLADQSGPEQQELDAQRDRASELAGDAARACVRACASGDAQATFEAAQPPDGLDGAMWWSMLFQYLGVIVSLGYKLGPQAPRSRADEVVGMRALDLENEARATQMVLGRQLPAEVLADLAAQQMRVRELVVTLVWGVRAKPQPEALRDAVIALASDRELHMLAVGILARTAAKLPQYQFAARRYGKAGR